MKIVLGLLGNTKVRVGLAVLVVIVGWKLVGKGVSMFRSVNTASFSTTAVGLTLDVPEGNEAYSSLDLTHLLPGADIYLGLDVRDSGSSGVQYGMITTSSGDGTLAKDLVVGVAAVSSGCDSEAYTAGSMLYPDHQGLDRAAFTGRALGSGSSDHLCFHVRLPLTVPGSLNAKSASATFDFSAEPA